MTPWEGRTPSKDEWRDILEKHARWMRGAEGGERANLQGAYLRGADLQDADLQDANLQDANLQRANLQGANLQDAKGADLAIARTRILPAGALIGWKKCQGETGDQSVIVKLSIPAEARRSHAFGRKCRAEYVDVLEVLGADVGVTTAHGPRTEYRAGCRVISDSWDEDWRNECSHGIHFFITREEAEAWV